MERRVREKWKLRMIIFFVFFCIFFLYLFFFYCFYFFVFFFVFFFSADEIEREEEEASGFRLAATFWGSPHLMFVVLLFRVALHSVPSPVTR